MDADPDAAVLLNLLQKLLLVWTQNLPRFLAFDGQGVAKRYSCSILQLHCLWKDAEHVRHALSAVEGAKDLLGWIEDPVFVPPPSHDPVQREPVKARAHEVGLLDADSHD